MESESKIINKPEIKEPSNRLAKEKSPYLLQHAHNPVDWYPWSDEAFESARREDKPIFLSIGYSTCHWCHVMAHESFEDPQVAGLMNQAFVPIKVDREERPDIDQIYMAACQRMTGRGGWPLTIIMTPDKKPFFAATYIPKESRFGMVGMMELIPRIQEIWKDRREEVVKSAESIASQLQPTSAGKGEPLNRSDLERTYEELLSTFDFRNGGFGLSPKFPTPHNLLFLLRYWKRTGEESALGMIETTLQAMRLGGIYDHIGHGFHRYSTDSEWFVPHFEKMLYDQALLIMAYVEAYQATGKEEYALTAREVLTYVIRDMTSTEGGFYSAEDADSEGVEGKFYLWTRDELRSLLDKKEYDLMIRAFDVREEGNFPEGMKTRSNILRMRSSPEDIAALMGISLDQFRERLDATREKLFLARKKRVHPHKDDKILADWNGLMIAAMAKAAEILGEPEYAKRARAAADFILEKMRTDGHLAHMYRNGASGQANLDDYAFLTWGLIDLYEATFDARYLRAARGLNGQMIEHFWDKANGGLYFTPDYGEKLLIRQKEIYDGAMPSGNSAAMFNLLRLSRLTGDPELEKKAEEIGRAFSSTIRKHRSGHAMLMAALDFAIGPSYEVALAGELEGQDMAEMLKALRSKFIPNKVVMLVSPEETDILEIASFARGMIPLDGKATAYVCTGFACDRPTTDKEMMLKLLGAKP
ncbi:MAG TPA: thioredoxin domain-containing protein [Methanotrichaceae archaeon]|nr:thioredoxin domain-containing protein [Methanotrichaceae archaeon]